LERVQADAAGSERCDYLFSLERVWRCDCFRAGDGVHRAWLERRKNFEPFWKPWSRSLFNVKHRQLLALEERMLGAKTAGLVIANSHMVKAEILRHYGYPEERIHVVYNGLPPRVADPAWRSEVRARLAIPESEYVVLFAGSGWERKGLRFAIEGMHRANLKRAHLLVAGRGNPRDFPGSDRIRFLGPVSAMEAHYAAADAFILPTLYDPFSNACLEALSAGLPVITTAANGFAEILQPGIDGEIVQDPRDTEVIARAIERWSDPERRAAIKPHLAALAARFTIKGNVSATLAVIRT
jgi:UDP-glucose:(heptosyl)LPS alpha-1,3-glucosyltransferase